MKLGTKLSVASASIMLLVILGLTLSQYMAFKESLSKNIAASVKESAQLLVQQAAGWLEHKADLVVLAEEVVGANFSPEYMTETLRHGGG